jgi:MinD-like ATPase involved in chromosome partitioning or flagellar assembly
VSIPVLTAVGDPRWEADLTAGLSREDNAVQVVRRCVDLADLLAAAAAGLARAVILSADLRRLDREALSRLELARVAVVGLVAAADESAERRLRQLGVRHVLAHDASAADVAAAVLVAVGELAAPVGDGSTMRWGDPTSALPGVPDADPDDQPPERAGTGRIIAVWGPTGAPGRSSIAVNLAAELGSVDRPALLIDADTYGGVVAALLGLLDEAPGLAAACRLANQGTLDVPRLAQVALEVRPGLRVLTGITRADRWLELRPGAIEVVLAMARCLAAHVVIDCGFCLEQDEELAYDTVAPRRNGATLAVLEAADVVVAVAAADPVGLARFVRTVPDCASIAGGPPTTVVNRLRRGVIGAGDPRREVTAALERYAGVAEPHVIPDDPTAFDAAMATGRTLAEVTPKSAARIAIRDLAAAISGESSPGRGPGGRKGQRRKAP